MKKPQSDGDADSKWKDGRKGGKRRGPAVSWSELSQPGTDFLYFQLSLLLRGFWTAADVGELVQTPELLWTHCSRCERGHAEYWT